jgi:geranylgeranyl diphosphate synthase type II
MADHHINSEAIENYILSNPFKGKPENLYNAMNYIMQLGGKRMRPQLMLLSYLAVKNEVNNSAFNIALALETFHNFSLVHDDIMDNAPIRRGKKTVHEEWDIPTAILVGDNLLIKCYELIMDTDFENKIPLMKEFTKMASLVCDGQQLDMNMPDKEFVTEVEYLNMIELKTAVLPACALKMGAMAAGANEKECQLFYDFGLNLGMAFQLQDDYLDAFGLESQIGKQVGGDILENKKTVLFIHALNHLSDSSKEELLNWYESKSSTEEKINKVKELFEQAGSRNYLFNLKASYEVKALEFLSSITMNQKVKIEFDNLFGFLKSRAN